MLMLLLTILESDFLKFFTTNREIDDWQDTASSWVLTALVISVLCAGLMLAYKWLRKYLAGSIKEKTWSRGETVLLMVIGLLPVFIVVLIFWYATRDYFNIIGVGGLIKGIVFSWLLYLLFMFIGHLVSPWRREIL
jgi:hypothetical protein